MGATSVVRMRKLTTLALARHKQREAEFATDKDRENPIVRDMRLKNQGRIEALEEILAALHGDFVLLRISAGD